MDVKAILLLFSLAIIVDANVLKHHFVLKSGEEIKDDAKPDDDWWKTAIFYQIYPRSFMDSNNDGNGDIQGIISKLDHLKDMGVSAAWLSPIYPSGGVDQGYDITNYIDVDPLFGNLTDLKQLIDEAHKLGIKIIMDFVPNHTSDKHPWFQQSVKNESKYKDYYIWADNAKSEPNNWVSIFGGSAWTWNKDRKSFYLHQFAAGQPDLNYRNPAVVKSMKEVLTFWLGKGVDGFRMDAVPYLVETANLPDEPLSGAANQNKTDYGYLKHIYTSNLDETYDIIYQFRAVLDAFNKENNASRIMMTEAYADHAEDVVRYYGNQSVNGAHFTFNFNFVTALSSNLTADKIITTTNRWLSNLDKKYVSNWVLGNHDQHRVANRLGANNVDALNMLTAFLPGIQVTYMGEEIGMEDGHVTFDDCINYPDPQVPDKSQFDAKSRYFERTPFQWDSSENAGFSNNSKTWLPVSEKKNETNLQDENVEGQKSHYHVYKDLVKFRENFKSISYDALSLIKLSDNSLEIVRKTDKAEFVYLFNTGDSAEDVNIFSNNFTFSVAVSSANSKRSVGDAVANPVTLQPHESIILEIAKEKSGVNPLVSTWLLSLLSVIFVLRFY